MKLNIQIKNRWTGSIIFELETENNTIAKTVNEYVKLARQKGLRANLTDANLTDANLTDANLTDANLTDANLTDANLTDANLTRADLTRADLTRADLTDADLTDANLTRADLTRADLTDANLTDANLTDANLTDANLTRADLDTIKYDFFGRMLMQKHEIPVLRQHVIDGKINGSSYTGVCSCFVGTIATALNKEYTDLNLKPNGNSPTERWFMGISEGMKPETHNICAITLSWIDEFLALIK